MALLKKGPTFQAITECSNPVGPEGRGPIEALGEALDWAASKGTPVIEWPGQPAGRSTLSVGEQRQGVPGASLALLRKSISEPICAFGAQCRHFDSRIAA